MTTYLVTYTCGPFLSTARAVEATDPINAIIAARAQERRLVGACCDRCTLREVRPA